MTEKEKFQKTFNKLHASPDVLTEVLNMAEKNNNIPVRKKRFTKKAAAVVAAAAIAAGSCGAAYAMDVGGIRRTVEVWIHGDSTNAEFTAENGSYTLNYKDADGKEVSQGGGGVAYENGKERPLTAEEMQAELNSPEVEYKDDGTVWVYYLDQKEEITDKFENGVCFVKLTSGGKTQYITVKYQNGYASSPSGYIQPEEFN